MKPTHLASLAPQSSQARRDAAHGAAHRGHQEEIIHGVGMRFTQEELLQVALAETQDQGEAGQDEQGEGHDPGHPVVLVVAVAVGVIIMRRGRAPRLHVDHMTGDLA